MIKKIGIVFVLLLAMLFQLQQTERTGTPEKLVQTVVIKNKEGIHEKKTYKRNTIKYDNAYVIAMGMW